MPRFLTDKDKAFIDSINNELINDVVETPIIIYKYVLEDSDDIYGEDINKHYKPGVEIYCIIDRSEPTTEEDEFGTNIKQSVAFNINRDYLSQKNIYPEIGDIIEWNEFYYQIDNIKENQYLLGRSIYNFSILVDAHRTDKSHINIGNRF